MNKLPFVKAADVEEEFRNLSRTSKLLLALHHLDVVVDWIASTPEDVEHNLRLFSGKTDQFTFISSASTQAYTEDEFREMLLGTGFSKVDKHHSLTGKDDSSQGEMFVLVGQKL